MSCEDQPKLNWVVCCNDLSTHFVVMHLKKILQKDFYKIYALHSSTNILTYNVIKIVLIDDEQPVFKNF